MTRVQPLKLVQVVRSQRGRTTVTLSTFFWSWSTFPSSLRKSVLSILIFALQPSQVRSVWSRSQRTVFLFLWPQPRQGRLILACSKRRSAIANNPALGHVWTTRAAAPRLHRLCNIAVEDISAVGTGPTLTSRRPTRSGQLRPRR